MITHVCADHVIDPDTETLIVGTFNPRTPDNVANFFYGRPNNAMWTFLAKAYKVDDLKSKSKEEKLKFLHAYHIDFIDLISEIGDAPPNYQDRLIDCQTNIKWNDVPAEIGKLKKLKRVAISRKGFKDVPNIRTRVAEIRSFLADKSTIFRCVHTPARARNRAWPEWSEFLHTNSDAPG